MKKIVSITCYKDYVRTHTIEAALRSQPDVEVVTIKNKRSGLLRYPEVLWATLRVRATQKPDAYLVNFRGYELLPFVLLIAGRKPVLFDEFINLTEWVVDEHKKIRKNGLAARLLNTVYGWLLRRCRVILMDTPAHAAYAAERSAVPLERYVSLPVGADNALFYPRKSKPSGQFTVLYYGSMLPVHGVNTVLEAAKLLQDTPEISFYFIGGKQGIVDQIVAAASAGLAVRHTQWVPYDELPNLVATAGVNLGGPFGNTPQSQHVVTGKTYQHLAVGAPTIIGKNASTADFTDKKHALVVPQANARALADAIHWAYAHPRQLAAIGAAGRKLYEQKFDEPAIAAQLQLALQRAGL